MDELDYRLNSDGTYSLTVSGRVIGILYESEDAEALINYCNKNEMEKLQSINEGLHDEIDDYALQIKNLEKYTKKFIMIAEEAKEQLTV